MSKRTKTPEYRRAWWEKNKERVNAARRNESGDKRERKKARNRTWWANQSVEQRRKSQTYFYTYGLQRRFNITLTKWLSIFHFQGERCACCGAKEPGAPRWHTDHDHTTGEIRGIVCKRCNIVLGLLGDTAPAVRSSCDRFLGYLQKAA